MTKKNWWKCLCLMLASLALSGCSLLEGLLFTKSTVPEFSFSGYVFADGKALEGAKVDCGISSTETDESGYFKFSNINSVVQVSASKDGYLFADDLIFVSSLSSNVNFSGYKLFDKSGVVKNSNAIVPNVEINATSENGTYETMSNEFGEFYLPNLAGQVKVTATKDGYNFFKSSFTIDYEDDIVISGMTNISGRLNVDADASSSDFQLKVNNSVVELNDDLTFVANDVEPGAVIELSSNDYYVSNKRQEILSATDPIVFDCYKYYTVTGSIVCGDVAMSGVSVSCGDKTLLSTDGSFTFDNVWGNKTIRATLQNYQFDNVESSIDNCNITLQGTTSVSGVVNMDIGQNFSQVKLSICGRNIECDSDGRFILTGVKFGDTLSISSDEYFVENSILIENREDIEINAYKYFACDIAVSSEDGGVPSVCVSVNGADYFTNEEGLLKIENLYDSPTIVIQKEGFKFEENYTCDYFQNNLQVSGYTLYSLSFGVKSGTNQLSQVNVSLNGEEIVANDNRFEINDIFGENTLIVSCENYNTWEMSINKDTELTVVNLSYNIEGTIKCGKNGVADVLVSSGTKSVLTDKNGKFVIENLYGDATVSYSKEFYLLGTNNVSYYQNLSINTSYSISGNITKKDGDSEDMINVSELTVSIMNKETGEIKSTTTNASGDYSFGNLVGEYVLFYDMNSSVAFKPKHYNVTAGGNKYDFSNKGYTFSGVIMCGDLPVEDVKVRVGNIETNTDRNGKYEFGLVTKSGLITLEKEGYDFSPVGHSGYADEENFDEKDDINYSATYKVCGYVYSGTTPLSGVGVVIGGQNAQTNDLGYFEINGLDGDNQVAFVGEGYKFAYETSVSGYTTLNCVATFDTLVRIVSGDLILSGATAEFQGKEYSTVNGEVLLKDIQIGDRIQFALEGYTIEPFVATSQILNATLNSSYEVSGFVTNCDDPLSDVKVIATFGGESISTMTLSNGKFHLSGIVGSSQLSFQKEGFVFKDIQLTGANGNMEVYSTFGFDGYIKVGNKALSGVKVYKLVAGDAQYQTTTDKNGYFKITDLDSKTTFTFEKKGYTISNLVVSSSETKTLSATYSISGFVKSGDIFLDGTKIETSDGRSFEAVDGKFNITGLVGDITLVVSMSDGNSENIVNEYNTKTIGVSEYREGLIIELDYDIIINFSSTSQSVDFSGIKITYGKETKTCDSSTCTIKGLKGKVLITLQKDNCYFSPTENDKFYVEKGEKKDISITPLYDINGVVTTKSGVAIVGAIVSVGNGKETITNERGEYSLQGISGEPALNVKLPYLSVAENKQLKFYTYNGPQIVKGDNVYGAGTYDISVSDSVFAVSFLNYAYDILRNSTGYKIFGSGTAVADAPVVGDQIQSVSTIYIEDASHNKIFQNLNIGKVVNLGGGVDPNVSLLTYFYTDAQGNRQVKYSKVEGESNFKNGIPQYGDWNEDKSLTDYKDKFGINYANFSPYVIDTTTVSSVTGLSFDGTNYSFVLNLDCSSATSYNYYKILMGVMCSKQELKNFTSIALTFTISKEGLLRKMVIDESYVVRSAGFDVPTDGDIVYDFFINSLNDNIPTLSISTPSNVQTDILKYQEEYSNSKTASVSFIEFKENSNNFDCDLVVCKREDLL